MHIIAVKIDITPTLQVYQVDALGRGQRLKAGRGQ